ncbi:NADPH-dependent FMN reductase [Dactylosporangium sp. CA-139114]|uniref:NADPH-dependent FMN reductase n=1 Tax=Dactylosporangium sp. CA-139114 TaxID=3239931 RepID=UPI003D95EFBE
MADLAGVERPLGLPAVPPKYAGEQYPRPAGMAPLTAALERADAFMIVTPEYNHSYPAAPKAAIDGHFTHRTAKPGRVRELRRTPRRRGGRLRQDAARPARPVVGRPAHGPRRGTLPGLTPRSIPRILRG